MKPAALLAALAVLAAGQPVAAQPRQPAVTLYAQPNFQGAAKGFGIGVDNLATQGFNDRARSVRVQGRWRLCANRGLAGRCVEVSEDVPDLAALGLAGTVSSFELLDRGYDGRPFAGLPSIGVLGRRGEQRARETVAPPPAQPAPTGPDRGRYLEGRTVGFFPEPPQGRFFTAEAFCRAMGFSTALYADGLRDIVCRR